MTTTSFCPSLKAYPQAFDLAPKKPVIYIFTGGPGFGKTTLLKLFTQLGLVTTKEAARKIIKIETKAGEEKPQTKPGFNAKVITLQEEQEKDAKEASKANHAFKNIVISDRSIVDPLAYSLHFDGSIPEDMLGLVSEALSEGQCPYSCKVFVIEPLSEEEYVQDQTRVEPYEVAVAIHQTIKELYRSAQFDIVEVKRDTVENRMGFIKQQIFGTE